VQKQPKSILITCDIFSSEEKFDSLKRFSAMLCLKQQTFCLKQQTFCIPVFDFCKHLSTGQVHIPHTCCSVMFNLSNFHFYL